MISVTYNMPANGLGTDFSEFSRPINFAQTYTNRFRNITGGAERRPGMTVFGSASVAGAPNLTRLHEFVSNVGDETLLSSDDFGNIYAYGASAWSTSLTGKQPYRLISAQAQGKLIFCNGVDRNFYTSDGGTTYNELKALITQGTLAGGSSTTTVVDGNVSNWISSTNVANNDIVHNLTRGGYGIVSTVASASLTTTVIGVSGNGAGRTLSDQAAGDSYELIDYVGVSALPNAFGGSTNVGTATAGTSTVVVAVSGVNFSTTEIRIGDFVYNTTRSAIGIITGVSASLAITGTPITGQISGDAVVFFKSAMPIASWVHVHYGRCYYLDSRNNQRIVISAPDDPQDVTTYQKTLDTSSFSFASQQPSGDTILSMSTFLSYFVASGKKNLYIYQGQTPIADTSSTTLNFTPIAFYPNGLASRFGLATNGADLVHITVDGLQTISIGYNAFSVNQNNLSVPIFNVIKQALAGTSQDNIQLTYYPRRRWLICKIGDQCFILNTNPSYGADGVQQAIASWHLFTGLWAQQNHYFVRRSGDILACGAQGIVYNIDSSAAVTGGTDAFATDVGTPIPTDIVTSWLRLEEPRLTRAIKEGQFIRPVFESGANVEYTINAIAGLDNLSSDTITLFAGGSDAIGVGVIGLTVIGAGDYSQANKYPLRWRGEQVRIEFTTESSASPDVITAFTLDGNIGGLR